MLTAGDPLAKTLAKYQKVTFWSKKNGFGCFFFLLTVVDALTTPGPHASKIIGHLGPCINTKKIHQLYYHSSRVNNSLLIQHILKCTIYSTCYTKVSTKATTRLSSKHDL